ncbi:hypothetical protein N9C08_02355 [Rubripirellula sp.]|nr:hypothetical protein [Rubripirellula sp.]
MNQPRTIHDVLPMRVEYHDNKTLRYRELAGVSVDPRFVILLDHVVELRTESARVIRGEMEHLSQ